MRRAVLLLFISGMAFLAFYNLSGVRLSDLTILRSLEEIGLAPLAFTAHSYARMPLFGFLLVGAVALLYGLQIAKPKEQAVSLVAVASAIGAVLSANFITLFFFWELLTISVAVLILLNLTPKAINMGYRFALFHLAGGLLLFLGIMQHFAATGSFAVQTPAAGTVFFAIAIGFKAAFLPFHVWVTWSYPIASFPTSVVLASLTTKIGVYAVARILEPHPAIVLMGTSMAVFGICCALLQKNMRRLLAYLIISSVGYMLAGAGMGSSYGLDGGMLHILNGMIYIALLFMSAGAVLYATDNEDLHNLSHSKKENLISPIWKGLPVAALGALIGSLALSGVPPFNGYVSKYLLKKALDEPGLLEIALLVAGVGTVVSVGKFFYFGFIKGNAEIKHNLTFTMKAAILLASVSCIVLGLYPQMAQNILPYHTKLAVYGSSGVLAALQYLGIGLLVFAALKRILERGFKPPAWVSVEHLIYRPLYFIVIRGCRLVSTLDRNLDHLYETSGKSGQVIVSLTQILDGAINDTYEKSGEVARRLAERAEIIDGALDNAYDKSGRWAKKLAGKAAELDNALDNLYQRSGRGSRSLWDKMRGRPSDWNIKNLNFDSFLIALMLGIFLFILVYYTQIR